MADIYKVWIQVEKDSVHYPAPEFEAKHTFEDIGEPECLDMEFTTPEAAEAIRTMMLGMVDTLLRVIGLPRT